MTSPVDPTRIVDGLGLAGLFGCVDDPGWLDFHGHCIRAAKNSLSADEARALGMGYYDALVIFQSEDIGWDVYLDLGGIPTGFRVLPSDQDWSIFGYMLNRFEADAMAVLECSVVRAGEKADVQENALTQTHELCVLDAAGEMVWTVKGVARSVVAVAEAVTRHPRDA